MTSASTPPYNLVAALILSYVFVLAGLHKCRAPAEFATTLANYRILPEGIDPAMRIPAPRGGNHDRRCPADTCHGTVLAAFSAGTLLCIYMAAIAVNLLRGRRNIDCGCGGPAQKQTISEWMIARNGILLLLAFIAGSQAEARAPALVRLVDNHHGNRDGLPVLQYHQPVAGKQRPS